MLNTRTFWSLCSSSRHETLSGDQDTIENRKLAQSRDETSFDLELIFENLVVFDSFSRVSADVG